MIRVEGLHKHYRVHRREPGVASALRSLFHRSYETVRAVDGISFSIEPGERVGFLGPNGAGKTTTLKCLSGLLHPTSGTLTVDGHVPFAREETFLKKIMLVLGQKHQLVWDLPPSETFELNRAIYDVPKDEYRRTLGELTDLLELGPLMNKPTRQLSLGERMKCELTAALLHKPRFLFLDEPTIGLDVSMQATIRGFIKDVNERTGATLLLTSHYMQDVEALCPRVIVIDRGVLAYDGLLTALVDTVRPEKRVVLRLAKPAPRDVLATLPRIIETGPMEQGTVDQGPCRIVFQVGRDEVRDAVARALGSLAVQDLSVEDPPLEEVMGEFFARTRAR